MEFYGLTLGMLLLQFKSLLQANGMLICTNNMLRYTACRMEQFNDLKTYIANEMETLLKYDAMSEELLLKMFVNLIYLYHHGMRNSRAQLNIVQ
jgi:hypothetical protein